MLWLNPLALIALATVAAPVLIHILVQRRAEQFPFPTLRFLRPTRLAAIRRRMLDDLALLAVRAALIAAAVTALAGPLLVTRTRRDTWDRRVARAIITQEAGAELAPASAGIAPPIAESQQARIGGASSVNEGAPLQRTFQTTVVSDGIRRALLWLETAPPARREIVIASPFPIGSITAADVAAIPAGIGVRFERIGTLPRERTVAAGRVLTSTGVSVREVTLRGGETSVRDEPAVAKPAWPIAVVASTEDRPVVDAAIAAVLTQHVWAAPPDRQAKVVLVGATGEPSGVSPAVAGRAGVQASTPAVLAELAGASAIDRVWMGGAVARVARDVDLGAAATRVTGGLADPRFSSPPWHTLTFSCDGRPLAAAARSSDTLLIASAAPAANLATPLLLRSIANAIADIPDLQRTEVMPIGDAVLQRWSRPPAPSISPRPENVDQDDRRWFWTAALALLVLETWFRRARPAEVPHAEEREQTRVA
jgi:hypothetical protein